MGPSGLPNQTPPTPIVLPDGLVALIWALYFRVTTNCQSASETPYLPRWWGLFMSRISKSRPTVDTNTTKDWLTLSRVDFAEKAEIRRSPCMMYGAFPAAIRSRVGALVFRVFLSKSRYFPDETCRWIVFLNSTFELATHSLTHSRSGLTNQVKSCVCETRGAHWVGELPWWAVLGLFLVRPEVSVLFRLCHHSSSQWVLFMMMDGSPKRNHVK